MPIERPLQPMIPISISSRFIPQIIDHPFSTSLRSNRHNIQLFMIGHRSGNLRWPKTHHVNWLFIFIAQCSRKIVNECLWCRIDIMQGHGQLSYISNNIPAIDDTLTIADLTPLFLFLSKNLGINILFIILTEKQLIFISFIICYSVNLW